MKLCSIVIFTLALTFLPRGSCLYSQCPNNNTLAAAGPSDLTPVGVGNTMTNTQVLAGEYVTINVELNQEIAVSLCPNSTYDTHLTLIREGDGVVMGFSDDFCGIQSHVVWTSTFTGVLRALVDETDGCLSNVTNTEIQVTLNGVFAVELVGFEAWSGEEGIHLAWKTASESGSAYFMVERSENGVDYLPIGQVPAAGQSRAMLDYAYQDHAVGERQRYYYRLKEMDVDGKLTACSEVVEVVYGDAEDQVLAYPNPSQGYVLLRMDAEKTAFHRAVLYNFQGQQVRTWALLGGKTDGNVYQLNLEGVVPGTYMLRAWGKENWRDMRLTVE